MTTRDETSPFLAPLRDDQGFIIPFMAITAGLIALLSIGYMIDVPTTHSASIRAQNAVDVGVTHGLYEIEEYQSSAQSAFDYANAVMANQYSTEEGFGRFSETIAQANAHSDERIRVLIPTYGADASDLTKNFYDLPTPAYSDLADNRAKFSTLTSILERTYEPSDGTNTINDFRNGITFWADLNPNKWYSLVNSVQVRSASTVMIKTRVSHLIIDPAFSMGKVDAGTPEEDRNYEYIFGTTSGDDGSTDDDMWPVASLRNASNPKNISYPTLSWTNFPNRDERFMKVPYGGADITGDSMEIFQFYASLADTLPWHYFKGAVTDSIDFMTRTSAFNRTTMIGLTGYTPNLDNRDSSSIPADSDRRRHYLIPIHPTEVRTSDGTGDNGHEIVEFLYDPMDTFDETADPATLAGNVIWTNFPGDWALHRVYPAFFQGFIDSGEAAIGEHVNAGTDTVLYTADDDALNATGHNRWELALGRDLFEKSSLAQAEYHVANDKTETNSAETALEVINVDERVRAYSVSDTTERTNWVDDNTAWDPAAAEPPTTDFTLSVTNGMNGAASGDIARNAVAWQAIRTVDNGVEALESGDATLWTRPDDGAAALNQMQTGWRDIPSALKRACENVIAVTTKYNSDSLYGRYRPADQPFVAVFAFGLFSEYTKTKLGKSDSDFQDDLSDALKYCVCYNNVEVAMFFLPLDYYDLATVTLAGTTIGLFENARNSSCSGGSENICGEDPDNAETPHPVHMFVWDFREFSGFDPLDADAEGLGAQAKLAASAAFHQEVPEIIKRLLLRFTFPI